MPPLYRCRACGFHSTRGGEFQRRDGVLFDLSCLEQADAAQEPHLTWVREAIEAAQTHESRLVCEEA